MSFAHLILRELITLSEKQTENDIIVYGSPSFNSELIANAGDFDHFSPAQTDYLKPVLIL